MKFQIKEIIVSALFLPLTVLFQNQIYKLGSLRLYLLVLLPTDRCICALPGAIYDHFQSYDIPFYLAGTFLILSSIIASIIPFVLKYAPPKPLLIPRSHSAGAHLEDIPEAREPSSHSNSEDSEEEEDEHLQIEEASPNPSESPIPSQPPDPDPTEDEKAKELDLVIQFK